MATKTARIELRAAPDREQRIRYAAKLRRQSLSGFILEAASDRAEAVISSSAATAVPSDFFDALWDALDEPPVANEALARRARSSRRVEQR